MNRSWVRPATIGTRAAFDVLIWTGLAVAVWAEVRGTWWELATGLVCAGVVMFGGRRWPTLSLSASAAVVLVELADPSEFRTWPLLVSATGCFLAGRRMTGGLAALPCFSAVALTGLALAAIGGDVWAWAGVVGPLLFVGVLPWLLGRYGRLRSGLAVAGWQRAEQLERERRLLTREARIRERTRIAQDMHDSLGHDLSLIAMRAGALELDPRLDPEHQIAAADLRGTAVDATERLREIVGLLRDDSEPASAAQESIEDIVARSRASGMDLELVNDLPAGTLPPMVERAAYRVVREALTNAAKHAPGSWVTVRLEGGAAAIAVTVTNGPTSAMAAKASAGSGRGLVGLYERVRLAGGSLRTGPRADGYEVAAELPLGSLPSAGLEHEAATPRWPAGPELSSESGRIFIETRRATRRGLLAAAGVPLAMAVAAFVVLLLLRVGEVRNSWLDPVAYHELHIGQQREDVAGRLPPQQVKGRPDVPEPPIPAGASCEYYRVPDELLGGPIDVYRICFAGGRLVGTDVIDGTAE